ARHRQPVHRRRRGHGDRGGMPGLNHAAVTTAFRYSSAESALNRLSTESEAALRKLWRRTRESAINKRPFGIPRQRRSTMKFTRTLLASALVALLAACSNGAQDSAQNAQQSADQAQKAAEQAAPAATAAAPAAAPASTAAAPASTAAAPAAAGTAANAMDKM